MLLTSVSILCVCVCAHRTEFFSLPPALSHFLHLIQKNFRWHWKGAVNQVCRCASPHRFLKGFFFLWGKMKKAQFYCSQRRRKENDSSQRWNTQSVWCFWMPGLRSTNVTCSLWPTLYLKKKPQANNASIPKIKEGRPCSTHTSTTAKKESSHSLKS